MNSSKLSKNALAAARRIAKRNNLSVSTVIAAFEKASKPKTRLSPKLIFLDR